MPLKSININSSLAEINKDGFPSPPSLPPDPPSAPSNPGSSLPQASEYKEKKIQLLLRSSLNTNSDISSTIPARTQFTNSAILEITPNLSPSLNLIGELEGRFVRFTKSSGYNSLNTKLGFQQKIGNQMYGQLAWLRKDLYGTGETNDLVENIAQLSLYREDSIAEISGKNLSLNSRYDFLVILANTIFENNQNDRFSHQVGLSLNYDFSPQLRGMLSYRTIIDDFINGNDLDARHQFTIQAIYKFNRNKFISGSASYLFGSFTDQIENFGQELDGFSFGINIGINLPLF